MFSARVGSGSDAILQDLGVPKQHGLDMALRAPTLLITMVFAGTADLVLTKYQRATGNQLDQRYCEIGHSKSGQQYVSLDGRSVWDTSCYAVSVMHEIFKAEGVEIAWVVSPVSIREYLKPNVEWPAERIASCIHATLTADTFGQDIADAWTAAACERKGKPKRDGSPGGEYGEEGFRQDPKWTAAAAKVSAWQR